MAHEFVLAKVAELGVPLVVVYSTASFLGGQTSVSVQHSGGRPIYAEAGVRQGDPLSLMLFVLATSFLVWRIHTAGLVLEHFWYVDNHGIRGHQCYKKSAKVV